MHSIERAQAVLAGGCDSPVRSGWGVDAPMFVQASARGAYAFDAAGRRFVDYIMAYGPLLFGHTHPDLVTGLDRARRRRLHLGKYPWRRSPARRTNSRLPSVDGASALRHVGNRSGDERGSRRARVHRAQPHPQVCRQLPRALRSRAARSGRIGRVGECAQQRNPRRHTPRRSGRALQRSRVRRRTRCVRTSTISPRSSSSRLPPTWDWSCPNRVSWKGCRRERGDAARCWFSTK